METEMIKQVIRVGNSAGVLLPKSWINGRARVELVAEPLNIKKDVLEILDPYLENLIGIYIVGSYARGEQTERSDVDILAIMGEKSGRIKREKYDILFITKEEIDKMIENNALPIIPMLKEAKIIINEKIIGQYKYIGLTKKNLGFYIKTGKSILKVNRTSIDLAKQMKSNCGDSEAYSLTLRLRSTYIIDCLIKGKKWTNREFLWLIKRISGSLKAYDGYLRVKDNKPKIEELPPNEAERLYDYVLKKIKEHEKWVKRKR